MFKNIMHTEDDWAALFARLALAVVFFPHGAQKVLGWFGGTGFSATLGMFGQLGLSKPVTLLVMAVEVLGPICLLLGLLSRVAALGIIGEMVGAVALIHRHFGFFINWWGTQKGEGYEYHILAIALALVVLIKGSGALSVDRAVAGPRMLTAAGPSMFSPK